ncbi:hypothetical protein MKX01_020715 [Papaver californicum]|nr:hypothetical protein MKX01_020715 [Papaver californicum]
MSCMQITACGPIVKTKIICPSCSLSSSQSCISQNNSVQLLGTPSRRVSCTSRYQRCITVCLFGNKGKPESSSDGSSPWKSLENAMGGLGKEKSIQDILREQMQNKEYADTGGGGGGGLGGRPPPSGGGGGGDGPEDEGDNGMLDEFVQVILATAGFLFLYAYIIRGDEIARLGKDILKFIVTRKKSLRLERIGDRWRRLYRRLAKKNQVQRDPFWLERAILNTPTWWHDPVQYKRYLASRLKRSTYE